MDFPEKDGFVSWLKEKSPRQIIARNWDAGCCPLAIYSGLWIQPQLRIGGVWGEKDDNGNLHGPAKDLPEWAFRFALAADEWAFGPSRRKRITAGRCLSILNALSSDEETRCP